MKPSANSLDMILVVDDEPSMRNVMVKTLHQCGYEALGAGDGLTAIELAQQHAGKICLAIVDQTMPGMSGDQTIDVLRQASPGLAVIFASGNHLFSSDMPSIRSDCTYLEKPFTVEHFLHLVDQAIRPQSAKRSDMAKDMTPICIVGLTP